MIKLFVSYNCGISYHEECEANTVEELHLRMKELDVKWLRWYVEEDDKITKEISHYAIW